MAKKTKKKGSKKKFETIVKFISPIFLIVAIILISNKTITGNAINGSSGFVNTIPIITILLISLLFFIVIEIKRRRD